MKPLTSLCGILALLGVVCIAMGQNDAATKDMDTLQGTWRAVFIEENGESVPSDHAKRFTYTFKGDRLHFLGDNTTPGADLQYICTLHPTKTPRAIDMELVGTPDNMDIGETELGIYKLDSDTLTICAGAKRPTEFSTKGKLPSTLVVLKREKK